MSLHLKSLLEDKWLLGSTTTYDSAEYARKTGRISDEQWTAYQFIWTWANMRFGGRAGWLQDRFYQRQALRGWEIGEKCGECGYAYGSKWLCLDLPESVIEWAETFNG